MASSAKRQKLVIIGAGMAGSKLASTLMAKAKNSYDITLIGEEIQAGYNRIMLSSLLANELSFNEMQFVDINALKLAGLMLITGDAVIDICIKAKQLTLTSQKKISYDKLVFATGSRASVLPGIDSDAGNVMSFRNLQDISKIDSLPALTNVCVIGGGLLGLEAAVGLVKRGHKVTLIHRSSHILNRQLDITAAAMLEETLAGMGIQFCLGSAPKKLNYLDGALNRQSKTVNSVELESGLLIATELVIVATGITPEVNLANRVGLDVNKAIIVNSLMETSDEHIYALGECTEFENKTFGLVAPIWQQLDTLVAVLKETSKCKSFDTVNNFTIKPIPTKLKVSGINLFSVGDI
ncbi:NAD(P)/FAD-dependent oxidoreductase, partial [Reinekea sp.]|uniref:NAD(P)/FAD-dependent oxidoreductase n=1 Tax=Reinekea sp. TaxID=1970455 RepID=UPI003989C1E5